MEDRAVTRFEHTYMSRGSHEISQGRERDPALIVQVEQVTRLCRQAIARWLRATLHFTTLLCRQTRLDPSSAVAREPVTASVTVSS
jgi:hypothetical protein